MRRAEAAAARRPGKLWVRRLAIPAALLLPLFLATACAPRLSPPGPGLAAVGLSGPELTDNTFITADGTRLPLRRWLPPDGAKVHGVVLALHGFNDYSEAFAKSGPALAAQGLIVYAYDQRGFGRAPHPGLWAGTGKLTGDATDASYLLRARYPDLPLYLLGESMGGAVVLAAMAGPRPPSTDGIILASPAVWARSTMPLDQRVALWIGARLFPWARFTGEGLGIQASDNIEMLRALGRDPLFIKKTRVDAIYGLVNLMDAALQAAPKIEVKTLLLYGAHDEVVPPEPMFEFWRHLPAAAAPRQHFAYYLDGWHMLLRDLDAQVVIDDIAAWTRAPNAPLPSPAEDYAAVALVEGIGGGGGGPALAHEAPAATPPKGAGTSETAAAACEGAPC